MIFFAHGGEAHTETKESVLHYFESWPIALVTWLALLIVIGLVVYFLSKKKLGPLLIVEGALLLGSGMFLYDASPVISIISLTLGLGLSLFFVLSMLSTPKS